MSTQQWQQQNNYCRLAKRTGGSSLISIKRILLLSIIIFNILIINITNAIEHDSLECEKTGDCPEPSHTIIKLDKRDDELARRIAAEHGMVVKGQPFLDSHYFVEHSSSDVSHRKKRSTIVKLNDHPDVTWVSEQRPKRRTKRDYVFNDNEAPEEIEKFHESIVKETFRQRRKKREQIASINPDTKLPVPKLPFPDPLYEAQWYLVGKAVGNYDMNVREAWALGYAGRNVSVSILDDGIQKNHPDLAENYDPLASTDVNDHDDDPTPQDNGDNKHGTRCAGEVASVAGNNQCGVGVAYHAKIGGVRMLDGPVSDSVEAASLNLNQDHIDIYSASWGPEDDGKTFDGPGPLARQSFYRGIRTGRGGKGNIFVWASGNGGSRQDSCSADGYTTSIYTLSISSATYDNHRPWYLEECPSTIASTYSSANINQPAIVTVDVPSGCTKMHTGTSASAPLAAGIIALALEANPSLTWRDMQHIVLRTANPTPLLNNPGWSFNGVGRRISNKFGYGLMDAGALVKLARVWKTVPEQHECTYEYKLSSPNPRPLAGRFQQNYTLDVVGCKEGAPVLYLEHVQVLTTIRFAKRGDLKLTLFSPMGTRAVLLPPRPQDYNQNGFHKWPFLSVQSWGEDPRGTWTLMIESVASNPKTTGSFSDWTLILYGTAEPAQSSDPKHTRQPVYQSGNGTPSIASPITSQINWQTVIIIGQCIVIGLACCAGIFACRKMCDSARKTKRQRISPNTDNQAFEVALTDLPKSEQQRKKSSRRKDEASSTSAASTSEQHNGTTTTEQLPIYESPTFSDLTSAGNCHPECQGGCSASNSAAACFACKHFTQSLRNRAGFKCVERCDDGYYQDNDKCKACSIKCKTCETAEKCITCHGAQLLIDVDHFGHFDHGQCVDNCPEGLISDYDTNLIQSRCVLKKNPCSRGYYEDERKNCVACDASCSICHGPGSLKCDECAQGYSNSTYGFCRPCCGQTANDEHCEDCSIPRKDPISSSSAHHPSIFKTFFIAVCSIGIFISLIYCCMKCFDDGILSPLAYFTRPNDNEYSQLNSALQDEDSDDTDDYDSDEEELFKVPSEKQLPQTTTDLTSIVTR